MRFRIEESTTTVNPDGTITVSIPYDKSRKSGRRIIIMPENAEPEHFTSGRAEQEYLTPTRMTPMIAAVVKAYQWKEEIESGKTKTLAAIAKRENVTISYISRIYRLTLLAPDIIEAILAGTQPKTLKLHNLYKPFPMLWTEQRKLFGFV